LKLLMLFWPGSTPAVSSRNFLYGIAETGML